jgi:hypothetical protein
MKRPATATIAVFLAVILVTAAIAAVLVFATDGAPAIEVGDETVSRESVNDELREWADFEAANARATNGAVTGAAGAAIATQIVYELLAQRYLDRTGERVTSDDRASAREQVSVPAFRRLPQWFQDRYLERQATFVALTRVEGVDDQGTAELRALRREARRTDVTVDSAYGRYAPALAQVVQYPTPFTPAQG